MENDTSDDTGWISKLNRSGAALGKKVQQSCKRHSSISRKSTPRRILVKKSSSKCISTLTQNSPPPIQLKNNIKQSSLDRYFFNCSKADCQVESVNKFRKTDKGMVPAESFSGNVHQTPMFSVPEDIDFKQKQDFDNNLNNASTIIRNNLKLFPGMEESKILKVTDCDYMKFKSNFSSPKQSSNEDLENNIGDSIQERICNDQFNNVSISNVIMNTSKSESDSENSNVTDIEFSSDKELPQNALTNQVMKLRSKFSVPKQSSDELANDKKDDLSLRKRIKYLEDSFENGFPDSEIMSKKESKLLCTSEKNEKKTSFDSLRLSQESFLMDATRRQTDSKDIHFEHSLLDLSSSFSDSQTIAFSNENNLSPHVLKGCNVEQEDFERLKKFHNEDMGTLTFSLTPDENFLI